MTGFDLDEFDGFSLNNRSHLVNLAQTFVANIATRPPRQRMRGVFPSQALNCFGSISSLPRKLIRIDFRCLEPSMAESFGARLRQRREEQGIALATIAEKTKIKQSLLEAL